MTIFVLVKAILWGVEISGVPEAASKSHDFTRGLRPEEKLNSVAEDATSLACKINKEIQRRN